MEEQKKLKERLVALLKKNPRSLAQLARDIGIGAHVLLDFWNMKRVTRYKTNTRIEIYLDEQENKL